MSTGPLSGIKVIDLTRILAGPLCTMNLGDMGADILKIEKPGVGDDSRSWGPPFVGNDATYFLGINRNKRSMTLNLKKEKGREIFKKLLHDADILIENFKVGTLERMGFTSRWIEKNVPKLIHCSITGYGDKGPKAGMPGYDFLLQAESGLMSITGEIDGKPSKLGVAIVDVCAGQYAAMSILAALNARQKIGKGQRIDLSLFNTSLTMLVNVASNYLMGGIEANRYGNGHPSIVPYNIFQSADGQIAIAVGNDHQFSRLAKCLGNREWSEDNRYKKNASRVKNREDIEDKITKALQIKKTDEWITLFQAASIPCSRINSVHEVLESKQTKVNNMVVEQEHLHNSKLRSLGIPFSFSETPARINTPPPLLGEHTDEILINVVGLTENEILDLRETGVI